MNKLDLKNNNRTSDHILTLKAVVNKYVVDQTGKKYIYTCFVDFQKAFDSIWYEGLFRKLENNGCSKSNIAAIKRFFIFVRRSGTSLASKCKHRSSLDISFLSVTRIL